jgi:hypothetical protein
MQQINRRHSAWRETAAATYLGSYVFPLLFVVYEVYRVGYWIALHGVDFDGFGRTGYESKLMLAIFAAQLLAEGAFLAAAWLTRQPELMRRLTNLSFGLLCSLFVLGFDYLLQIAF